MPSQLPSVVDTVTAYDSSLVAIMDLIRAASPSASTTSSLDSNGLPQCRIHCNKSQIRVGSQKFQSATDALVAYLNQFDLTDGTHTPVVTLTATTSPNPDGGHTNTGSGTCTGFPVNAVGGGGGVETNGVQVSDKGIVGSGLVMGPNGLRLEESKEDVEKLLTSKVSPELKEEVTDTLREVKLRHLLKKAALKSQKQTKTGLQQEVEAALARSAKLLEKVTREDIPSAQKEAVVCDISNISISTDVLLCGSSDDSILSMDSVDLREKPNGHVYAYRLSPQRAAHRAQRTASPTTPQCNAHRQSRLGERRGSVDSLLPPNDPVVSRVKVDSVGSSNSLSNNSDPSDIIRRIRSRSVPPRLHKERAQSPASDWLSQLDNSVSKSVPSWVKNMSPSEITDSLWLPQRTSPQKPSVPSWIEQVDKSNLGLDISALESFPGMTSSASMPSKILGTVAASDNPRFDSRRGGDFNFLAAVESRTDLGNATLSSALSPSLNNSAKHVTFGDSEMLPHPAHPIHSTPIVSRNPKKGIEKYSTRSLSPSKALDSEYNGEACLRNNILPQTARLKRSMERFASSTENLRKSPSSNSSDASSDHKCSSLDTFGLLTGKAIPRADGPKPKSSRDANGLFPDSPAISSILPEGSQGHLSNGHSSSDGLDGDRSWEAMTNTFKPPVPVGRDGVGNHLNNQFLDADAQKRLSTSLSGGNQPGSMEALKNMLFKLQAEENCVQEVKADNPSNNEPETMSSPAVIPGLQDYDFQMEPGGHSLEKALLHLNRLKTLVKNTAISSNSSADIAPAKTSVSHEQTKPESDAKDPSS